MFQVSWLLRWLGRLFLLLAALMIVLPEFSLVREVGLWAALDESFAMTDVVRNFAAFAPGLLLLGLAELAGRGTVGRARRRRRRRRQAVPGAGAAA